jgi:thiosulfate sulfurtransferase
MTRTLVLLVLVSAVAVGASAAPQIAVDLATYNYPDTVEGIAVVHTFMLSNVGDQELSIESAIPGCHCTTAELAKNRLQPGESVGLYAILDTEGFSGHVVRTITITSNATDQWGSHQLIVSFVGNVVGRQPYQKSVSDLYYDSYVLLDVRDAAAYAAGHLAGAMSLPMSQVASVTAALPPGALTIVYDQNGSTSAAAGQALHAGGLAAVYALRGGLDLWQKSYGSVRVVAGTGASWSFLDASGARAYSTSGTVSQYDVSQLLSDYVLIDLRSPSSFAAGHIAGALNLSETEISAFIDTLPRATPVIVYSADGTDSDRVVYNLWMHGSRAQSLLGGLAEWQKQHANYLIVSSAS